MTKFLLVLTVAAVAGCSGVRLSIVNTTGKPIKNIEIKVADKSNIVPELADGATHEQDVKVEKPLSIGVNYLTAEGQQYYSSSPVTLNPGEGGSLKLSITAKGTLEATRKK